MGNTTDKPCKVCGQAADSSSRECVQCKVPVCKTHKHMCMTSDTFNQQSIFYTVKKKNFVKCHQAEKIFFKSRCFEIVQ